MIGGLLAAWTNDASEPAFAREIYLQGMPITQQRGTIGNGYGVPFESVVFDEQGPGGVSSLSFQIEDPQNVITLSIGAEVRFYNVTRDRAEFTGWLQSWDVNVYGLGRIYTVQCIGAEAILDWAKVPSLNIAAGTIAADAVCTAVAAATGIGVPWRAAWNTGLGLEDGNSTLPVGNLNGVAPATTSVAVTVTAVTLREAIRAILDATPNTTLAGIDTIQSSSCSVDMGFGIRVWRSTFSPGGYASLTVNDAIAGPVVAGTPTNRIDGGGIERGVYVVGGNAAGTGFFGDNSGIPGDVAVLNDSTILTAAAASQAALAYLANKEASLRGQITLEPGMIPAGMVRAGSQITITDTQLGLSALNTIIGAIRRTYTAGAADEEWLVTFGGLPPSLTAKLRRLTRSTLS